MQVTVQVSDEVAYALNRQGHSNADAEALTKMVEESGFVLQPMHPDTDDPYLRSYYALEVQDQSTARKITERLLELGAVKAAYVKPADEQA